MEERHMTRRNWLIAGVNSNAGYGLMGAAEGMTDEQVRHKIEPFREGPVCPFLITFRRLALHSRAALPLSLKRRPARL